MSTAIWWSNAVFFVVVHVAAIFGAATWAPVHHYTLILAFVIWQLGTFGITIGYHRLYSHRAFHANLAVRATLAAMGSTAFQGSIKWWCVNYIFTASLSLSRHLSGLFGIVCITFTDDPVHDPYAATRGLLFSHMGWIFFRTKYERMELVDREDLIRDPVVEYQHKFYVPSAIFFGFIIPTALGHLWGDTVGAFIWGGLVSKLAIWHCTFLVNSLAHWDGLQPYSDEDTSRGNLILALLTGGEGNHNFHHTFPHDFRSGPSVTDWDPSKWIILFLHRIGFVTRLRRANKQDLIEAVDYMRLKNQHGLIESDRDGSPWAGAEWSIGRLREYIESNPRRYVVQIDGFAIDVTKYLSEHPGGAAVVMKYCLKHDALVDATWAFDGGLNNHSRAAKRRMRSMRVARLQTYTAAP